MVKQATSEAGTGVAAPATAAPYSSTTSAPVPTRFAGPIKGLRIAQMIFGIIVLGLTAYLVYGITHTCVYDYDIYGDFYCTTVSSPGHINFNVFCGVWTFLICLYLIPAAFKTTLHHSIAVLVLDALSVVFWFAGFIALAVFTGYYAVFTGDDFSSGFGILVAAAIFGALEWIFFVITLAFTALGYRSAKTHSNSTPMQQYPGVAQHA